MGGRSMLRKVANEVHLFAPIAYVGDWNKAGSDIERSAERFLRENGWQGEWQRVAITDAQAQCRPHKMKVHRRRKVAVPLPSVETSTRIAEIRGELRMWLSTHLPDEPTATDENRPRVVDVLESLREELDGAS